jgi:hypothetical protein
VVSGLRLKLGGRQAVTGGRTVVRFKVVQNKFTLKDIVCGE